MPTKARKSDIPYQHLLRKDLFEVYRIRDFVDELSMEPHRHDVFMLIWATTGEGQHLIDFEPFKIRQDSVFFLRPGQLHQMQETFPDGWMLVFEAPLLQGLLSTTLEEHFAMFDYFNQHPYIQLSEEVKEVYVALMRFLYRESNKAHANLSVVPHYVFLLLLHAQRLYLTQHLQHGISNPDQERLRQLRLLIDKKYKQEHEMGFYTLALGISARKLNEVTRLAVGKTVLQLVQERILTESKFLLLTTTLSVKEITFELGFNDPAYFGRFFKKFTGLSPAAYKEACAK